MLGQQCLGLDSKEEQLSRRNFLLGIGLASAVALPMLSAPARAAVSMLRTGLDPDLVETESEVIPAGKRGGGGKGRGGGGKGRGGGHHGGKHHGGKHHGRGGKHHGGKHHGHGHGHGHGHHGHRHGHGGRWWHGRWYAWGGPCWTWTTPGGWIWVCH
jgi:hypothetical protein